jgi:3-methyladenine DNA glycosylase AlkD
VHDTLAVSRVLVDDAHPLVQKGAGWMLRYAGEVDRPALLAFLDELAPVMPRAMLRAAVEKLEPGRRTHYLAAGGSWGSR